jgi:hypothetical protein
MAPAASTRVRVAMEPKCTLTTDSCDNNKISTFFNVSFSSVIQALRLFFLFPVIKIVITRIDIFEDGGSNSGTVCILGLTYIPVPMLLTGGT